MTEVYRTRIVNITNLLIPVWATVLTLLCACLMVSHWVPLPVPTVGSTIDSLSSTPLATVAGPDNSSHPWRIRHFLYVDCPCSRKVFSYLIERGPLRDTTECLVLIGSPTPDQLSSASGKFLVEQMTEKELVAKYGVESAPLLVVTDAEEVIRYAGGYTSRKQGLNYQDQAIIQQLQRGHDVEALPVFGCAVSQRLKRIVDPAGLK